MRALVTGGAGYVGSHVVDALLEVKAHIVVLDNLSSEIDYVTDRVKVSAMYPTLEELRKGERKEGHFDVVVHCAARSDIRGNWHTLTERERLWADNFALTRDLLELVDAPMIFVSSSSVYGTRATSGALPATPCREDQPTWCESPYAASKVAGEALVQAYAHKREKRWHVLRPGIILGERYWHGHIADFVDQAQRKGAIQSLTNGTESRTVVHARDFARAVALCAAGHIPAGIYNVGHGVWTPRQTVVTMAQIAKPKPVTASWNLESKGWVGDAYHVLDATKLRGTGWVPLANPQDGARDVLRSLKWGET
jgi:UDP-glucose 4-epimerase